MKTGPSRRWVNYPEPTTFGDRTVAEKFKVHKNAPFKKKIKKHSPRGEQRECFPGPAVALDGPGWE